MTGRFCSRKLHLQNLKFPTMKIVPMKNITLGYTYSNIFTSGCFLIRNFSTSRVEFSYFPKVDIKFTLESLLERLNYLIDNAYIIFDGNVYRQAIGIPVGTNADPHVANIYLHQYENDYFNYLYINNMKGELSKLKHVFRFQDDLISFNDH